MADTALASLTDGSTAQATDIIYAVRDPSGTPLDRKLTIANVRAYLLAQANTWTDTNTFLGVRAGSGGYTFDIDQTTGFYASGANTGQIYIYLLGALKARFYNGLQMDGSVEVSWQSSGVGTGIATALKKAASAVVSVEGNGSVGGTLRAVPRRATQITADQNDYAPGGTSLLQFWSSDAARSVTGLSLSQVDGQQHEVWNIGSNNIVLVHQSASSTAANRFLTTTGADLTLSAGQMAFLRYDNTQSRWLAVKGT